MNLTNTSMQQPNSLIILTNKASGAYMSCIFIQENKRAF